MLHSSLVYSHLHGPLYAPDEPTGGAPEPKDEATPKDDGVGKITLNQADYDRLKAAETEVSVLKGTGELAKAARLAFSKEASEEARQEAIVTLMKAAGHSDEEIAQTLGGEEPEETPAPRRGAHQPANQRGGEDSEARQQLKALQEEAHRDRLERLQEKHQGAVEAVFKEGDLAKLLQDMTEGLKPEDAKTLRETLREDVVQSSRDILRRRRDQEGVFQVSWIPEAVEQAASKAAKKARLMGGGSRVGRSGELSPVEDEFLKQPAKKLPHPLAEGDGEQALAEYAVDRLTRAALEGRKAGESRA